MSEQTIKPFDDRLFIRKVDLEVQTKGGIILSEIEKERETCFARVIAVGEGKRIIENGKATHLPMRAKVGDYIVCSERTPIKVTIKGERFFTLREGDCMAIIDDPELKEKEYITEGNDDVYNGKAIQMN